MCGDGGKLFPVPDKDEKSDAPIVDIEYLRRVKKSEDTHMGVFTLLHSCLINTPQLFYIRQSFNGELAVTELRQIAIEGDQSFCT